MNTVQTLPNGQTIRIQSLTMNDLLAIQSLQENVIAALPDTSFLQPLSEEEFGFILNGNGSMLGAFHEEELIAFRAMLEPEIDEEHLGRDAGLSENELPSVLYSEISNVHPAYRGNGLQKMLGKMLMEQVDTSRFRYVCTTVAPFNIASLKDKFSLGMHIISLKVKYGNLIRYTMMKELTDDPIEVNDLETILIDMSYLERQQALLKEGWIGVGMRQEAEEWKVIFKKKRTVY